MLDRKSNYLVRWWWGGVMRGGEGGAEGDLTIQQAFNQGGCAQVAPLHHLDGYQAVGDEAKEERRNEGPRDCKN